MRTALLPLFLLVMPLAEIAVSLSWANGLVCLGRLVSLSCQGL